MFSPGDGIAIAGLCCVITTGLLKFSPKPNGKILSLEKLSDKFVPRSECGIVAKNFHDKFNAIDDRLEKISDVQVESNQKIDSRLEKITNLQMEFNLKLGELLTRRRED